MCKCCVRFSEILDSYCIHDTGRKYWFWYNRKTRRTINIFFRQLNREFKNEWLLDWKVCIFVIRAGKSSILFSNNSNLVRTSHILWEVLLFLYFSLLLFIYLFIYYLLLFFFLRDNSKSIWDRELKFGGKMYYDQDWIAIENGRKISDGVSRIPEKPPKNRFFGHCRRTKRHTDMGFRQMCRASKNN